jgi:hypothetical protein
VTQASWEYVKIKLKIKKSGDSSTKENTEKTEEAGKSQRAQRWWGQHDLGFVNAATGYNQ